ncbi:MAG: beta-agarase [Limisphaerales bacterium]
MIPFSLPTGSRRFAIATIFLGGFFLAQADERDLLGPELDTPFRSVGATAVVETVEARRVLRVQTGQEQSWPGVTFMAPGGAWNLSGFARVVVKVKNTGPQAVAVNVRVDNAGADGRRNCVTGSAWIEPGATSAIHVELKRTTDDRLDGTLFGMRGYPVKAGGGGTIDPTKINQFLVFLNQPQDDHQWEVCGAVAEGEYTAPTAWTSDAAPFLPLIDTLGQYRHRNWPGKTDSRAALERVRAQEAVELEKDSGPSGWNRYGGWAAGPQLDGTGFFRVQKHEGRWWLVDPDGRLFWSHGIDCVQMLDFTPIEERDDWFAEPPWLEAGFSEFLLPAAYALKGHYAGRSPRSFAFGGANLKRKYGPDWKEVYPGVIHRRLRAWGLNTIANWSDRGVTRMRRTPYTDSLASHGARMIEGSEGYWGKFPDVFDPGFREQLRKQMAGKQGGSAGDPWCLGYFSDNEMSWGDDLSLAVAALVSPAGQAAKQALVAALKAKYEVIGGLNAGWGTDHANWAALASSTARPDLARAGDDLRAFYTQAAERYFGTVRDVIKEVAPRQLYLGCRFAWANARAAAAAAKYCDVVSYNLYQRSVAGFVPVGAGDVPLLIGEFHFGALDRGLFHTGLGPVENQAARAEAYSSYVRGALKHPQFVGTHWFQYQDEPTTGRVYDEENYQIGFVDIADTPYRETVAASRAVAAELYQLRLAP